MRSMIYIKENNVVQDIVAVFYISLMLLTYPYKHILPSIRLSQLVYFDIFRLLLIIGCYVLFLKLCIRRTATDILLSKEDKLLCLFFLSLVISLLWSVDQKETIRQLYWMFYCMLLYIFLIIVLKKERVFVSLNYYFLIAPFVYIFASLIIFSIYGTLRPPMHLQMRSEYFFIGTYCNHIAAASEVAVPFLYSLVLGGKGRIRKIAVLSIMCILVNLILSESRGSLLAVMFMTAIYFAIVYRRKDVRIKWATLVTILALIIYITSYIPVLKENIISFRSRLEQLRDIKEEKRYQLYKIGIDMIKQKSLLGWGYGTHGKVTDDIYDFVNFYEKKGVISHNFIITIWSGSGLLSLLLFVYLIFDVLKKLHLLVFSGKKSYNNKSLYFAAIYVSLIGTIFHGLFRPLLTNINFYFILALASIAIRRIKCFSN